MLVRVARPGMGLAAGDELPSYRVCDRHRRRGFPSLACVPLDAG
jgi:hypothetical protein